MELPLIVSVAAWCLGSFVSGLCGIGAGAIATAIQLTLMPVQKVILVSCLTGFALGLAMFTCYCRHCRWKTALMLFAGTFPGSFLGLYILQNASSEILQIFVGIMLIFCTVGIAVFNDVRFLRESTAANLGVGFAGGVLGTCVNIDGPVVAIYGLQAGWSPLVFLGTTSTYFILRLVVTLSVQLQAGLYTADVIRYALWCIPFALTGFLVSIPVVRRFNTDTFRKVVQGIIVLAGVLTLGRALLH